MFRDSVDKELIIVDFNKDIIINKLDSLKKQIEISDEIINIKINKLKYEKQEPINYTILSNDSLLQRLRSTD